jgi:tripartite-type tricarboxylate transporter receptor subunit TctC
MADEGQAALTPEDTTAFIRSEEQVWRPLVRELGLAAE